MADEPDRAQALPAIPLDFRPHPAGFGQRRPTNPPGLGRGAPGWAYTTIVVSVAGIRSRTVSRRRATVLLSDSAATAQRVRSRATSGMRSASPPTSTRRPTSSRIDRTSTPNRSTAAHLMVRWQNGRQPAARVGLRYRSGSDTLTPTEAIFAAGGGFVVCARGAAPGSSFLMVTVLRPQTICSVRARR
jgi:hypothetical protein